MISRDEAFQKAKSYIEKDAFGLDIVVPDEWIQDRGWCWVFCYNTRVAYETGDPIQGILGAPLVVVKETGDMYQTGTAYPVDYFLAEIRQGRGFQVS